jgi:uncharacterized membrane protein
MDSSAPLVERKIEPAIALLLRVGVGLASIISIFGAVRYWMQGVQKTAAYGVFRVQSPELSSLHGIIRGALLGHGESLMQLGLVVLIATPIARVVLSLVGFWLERDRLYVALTFLVLLVLGYSLLS